MNQDSFPVCISGRRFNLLIIFTGYLLLLVSLMHLLHNERSIPHYHTPPCTYASISGGSTPTLPAAREYSSLNISRTFR